MTRKIVYKSGYKYQLAEVYRHDLGDEFRLQPTAYLPWWVSKTGATLFIMQGYAWDGPSGPTIDTKTSMRASLVHDVLYQLMRLGLLNEAYREAADLEFYRILREDGMCWLRAKAFFWGVRLGAAKCARPGTDRKAQTAP